MKETGHPLRVILMENTGSMTSLWLPATIEGRYFFDARNGSDEDIPICIMASEGRWVAVCGADGFFDAGGTGIGSRIVVEDQLLLRAVFPSKQYIIYTEKEDPEDHVFIPCLIRDHSEITIGRNSQNDICYPNKRVSSRHAVLRFMDESWHIIDNGSTNGVFLNGRKIKDAPLKTGDMVYIMGLYIIMGVGFIALNNKTGRIVLNGQKIRAVSDENELKYGLPEAAAGDAGYYERQPRRSYQIEPEPIEIESPPMAISENKVPFLLRMGSPALMGGQALLSGNVVSALSSMVLPFVSQGLTEKDRKEYDAKRNAFYSAYLDNKEEEVRTETEREIRTFNRVYPPLSEALAFPEEKKRLWERRKFDADFLSVRIGTGRIPMAAKKEFPKRHFDLEKDPLTDRMYELAERKELLTDAPIMLSLRDDHILGVKGKREEQLAFVSNMILQLALTHSYDEVKIVVLGDPKDLAKLNDVRYLPHNWDDEKTIRFFGSTRSDAQMISKYLNDQLAKMEAPGSRLKETLKEYPAFVIFALDKELYDCVELFKGIQKREEYCGFTLISVFDNVPKECSKLITLYDTPKVVDLFHPEDHDQAFRLDTAAPSLVRSGLAALKSTKLRLEKQAFSLPSMVTFLEMYGVGLVEHLNPLKRWMENDPVQSLEVPVGIGTDGKRFTLDLHEKRQGPHGLIAGGTGSGKSELIITYILSMAVNFSPDEVAFVLIDYKGGGLADAFVDEKRGIHLPHVVGTITNLDGASISRSLMSIQSELRRRQAVFSRARRETNEGTLDIYDYQKLYRNKRVSEPMPHLFIISDEFAELKKQQPEFMDELISIARIGRSLGIHLILSTQKPTGVVNEQIWSNTRFRICLKVADRSDSMEMLKRPEAAEIRNTGRFYLQVGYNEYFAQGQSAWCGAGYIPQEEVIVEKKDNVRFLDNMGQTVLNARPYTEKKRAESKQVVAIVKYLSDLAKREGIMPASLWKDPLPEKLELRTLMEENPVKAEEGITAMIGLADDPEYQEQFPFKLRLQSIRNLLICGNSGSGKSTLIRTMLTSLVTRYSPKELNYYILDLSGGALSGLSKAPHCGAYLNETNEEAFTRLLTMIRDIIAERKKLFLNADVTSYEAYRETADLPLILFILDGYTNINLFRKGPEFHSELYQYMREGSAYGIRTIVAVNHLNEVHTKARQEEDHRIALQAKDRYEYTDILGVKVASTISEKIGRGMCVIDGRPLEYQTAVLDAALSEQERAKKLKELLKETSARYSGIPPAQRLPMAEGNEEYEDFCNGFAPGRIPLGYSLKDLKKTAIPFRQLHSISLYFGNSAGIRPVFSNMLSAARMNRMDPVIVKKASNSIFDLEEMAEQARGARFLDPTAEGLKTLQELLADELVRRNVFRDAYCEEHRIPSTDKGRVLKAEAYIRKNTVPLLVIFESLGDICRLRRTEEIQELEQVFQIFFERTKGYNMYFIAGFYPEDEGIRSSAFMKSFNREQFALLFGGKTMRQCVVDDLPLELRRQDKAEDRYDRFLMKYRDELYLMRMPMGELTEETGDPDDASIV